MERSSIHTQRADSGTKMPARNQLQHNTGGTRGENILTKLQEPRSQLFLLHEKSKQLKLLVFEKSRAADKQAVLEIRTIKAR